MNLPALPPKTIFHLDAGVIKQRSPPRPFEPFSPALPVRHHPPPDARRRRRRRHALREYVAWLLQVACLSQSDEMWRVSAPAAAAHPSAPAQASPYAWEPGCRAVRVRLAAGFRVRARSARGGGVDRASAAAVSHGGRGRGAPRRGRGGGGCGGIHMRRRD